MKYMNTELRRLRAMSRSRFFGYLVLMGGLAGLFAWILVLCGSFAFGFEMPTGSALLLAIPRGSIFAIVFGLLLRWYWRRRR